MGEYITFYYRYSDSIFHGEPVVTSDTSILFNPRPLNINFSILLARNWRFYLNLNIETKRCVIFTGFFHRLAFEITDLKYQTVKKVNYI